LLGPTTDARTPGRVGRTCWGQLRLHPTNSEVENSGYRLRWLLADCCPKRSRSSGQSRLPNLGEICSGNAGSFSPRTHDLLSAANRAEISSPLTAWFRQLRLMQSTRLMRVASRVVSYRRPPLSFVSSWTPITVSICEATAPLFAVVETGPNLWFVRGGCFAHIYHVPDVVLDERATPESGFWFGLRLMQSTRLMRVASRVVSYRRPPLSFVSSWTPITVSICEATAPLFAVVETGPNLWFVRGGCFAQIYHVPDVVLGDRATPESSLWFRAELPNRQVPTAAPNHPPSGMYLPRGGGWLVSGGV